MSAEKRSSGTVSKMLFGMVLLVLVISCGSLVTVLQMFDGLGRYEGAAILRAPDIATI